jgi:phosphoenolpyruvate carboxylase
LAAPFPVSKNPKFGDFWKKLHEEYLRTSEMIRELSGQELLSGNAMTRASIGIRENIVLPLIAIQQFAMQRLQTKNLSSKEIETYQHLVLRAMFGIINAARNAA